MNAHQDCSQSRGQGKMHCCYLSPPDFKTGCGQPARFLIYPKTGQNYDNYTHACGDHVEDLKSSEDDVVEKL